jgi:hypothetical protein
MVLVVLSLLIGIGASILSTTSQGQCTGALNSTHSYAWNSSASACYLVNGSGVQVLLSGPLAYNSTAQGITAMNTFSQWQSTFYTVLAAAVIVGLVMAYLVWKKNN